MSYMSTGSDQKPDSRGSLDGKTSKFIDTKYEYPPLQKGGYIPDKNPIQNAMATVMIKPYG